MSKRIYTILFVAGMYCVVGTQLFGQNPFPPDPVNPGMDPPQQQFESRQRENPRERLEMLRVWKMTEFLELDESQADRFFPALRTMQQQRYALDSMTVEIHGIIHTAVEDGEITQQQVDNWRQQILNNQQEKVRLEREFMESLPEYLTAEQQAKYLIFEQRFQQVLWDIIRQDRDRN